MMKNILLAATFVLLALPAHAASSDYICHHINRNPEQAGAVNPLRHDMRQDGTAVLQHATTAQSSTHSEHSKMRSNIDFMTPEETVSPGDSND